MQIAIRYIVLVYILDAFATWGYLQQRPNLLPERADKDGLPVVFAVVWPIYWAARISLKLTKP